LAVHAHAEHEDNLKRVRIGRVPDRGGRVDELDDRTMKMDVFRANTSMRGGDSRGGGRGGARGGARGGGGGGRGRGRGGG
jgi:protein FAM98B